MSDEYRVVDTVSRETAELLQETDATLAWGDEKVFVLEDKNE
jgi:hypothetical protein